MFDDAFRRWKHVLFAPLAVRADRVSPTAVSLLAFGFGILSALAAAFGQPLWALWLWLLNRLADGVDGEIARAQGKSSDFGGYLDMLLDVTIYALLPAALAYSNGSRPCYAALALLLGSFYINVTSWTYLGAILQKRGTQPGYISVVMPPGLIAGTETVVFYCAFFLLPQWLPGLFVLMAALMIVTVLQRLIWAWRNLVPVP